MYHEFHVEGPRANCDPRPDIAHADDTEGFAGKLCAGKFEIITPAVFFHRAIGFVGVARQGDYLSENQLRHRDGVAARLVGHPDF